MVAESNVNVGSGRVGSPVPLMHPVHARLAGSSAGYVGIATHPVHVCAQRVVMADLVVVVVVPVAWQAVMVEEQVLEHAKDEVREVPEANAVVGVQVT